MEFSALSTLVSVLSRDGEFMFRQSVFCCRYAIWASLVLGLIVNRAAQGGAVTEGDVQQGEAEAVRRQVQQAALLPGGEVLRQLSEEPVIVWASRIHLGIDDAFSGTGTRYLAVRLTIANRSGQDLELDRQKIMLHLGKQALPLGKTPHGARLGLDHEDLSQAKLTPPPTIRIGRNGSAEFWCLFPGLDPVPIIPAMILRLEFDSRRDVQVDLNLQQLGRLALTSQRIGPRQALGLLTIHGELNTVNAGDLASAIEALFEQKTQRIVVEWTSEAASVNKLSCDWLISPTSARGRESPLLSRYPLLPPVQQICLAHVPHSDADAVDWEESNSQIFDETRLAVAKALEDVLQRADPGELIEEVRHGHPWSREATLSQAADRLGPESFPTILNLVRSSDKKLRRSALIALGYQDAADAQDELWKASESSDSFEAESGLRGFLISKSASHRGRVLKLLNQEQLNVPRTRVLELLAENYHPDWDEYLAQAARDQDATVRKSALKVLEQLGHRELEGLSIAALSDADRDVRETAFGILSTCSNARCEQAAIGYALDQFQKGEYGIAELAFVERLRETRAGPLLLSKIEKSKGSRTRLIDVLGAVGSDQQISRLFEHFDELSTEEQAAALLLTNRLATTSQLEIARQAAKSSDRLVRNRVVEILKRLATDEAVMTVGQMLDAADGDELEQIAVSLGEIGTPTAIHQLRQFREKAVADGRMEVLRVVEQGLKIWQTHLPGWRYVEEGMILSQRKDPQQALSAFSIAILMDPELVWAYYYRGQLHLQKEDFENAHHDLDDAIRLEPYFAEAYSSRGNLFLGKMPSTRRRRTISRQSGSTPMTARESRAWELFGRLTENGAKLLSSWKNILTEFRPITITRRFCTTQPAFTAEQSSFSRNNLRMQNGTSRSLT